MSSMKRHPLLTSLALVLILTHAVGQQNMTSTTPAQSQVGEVNNTTAATEPFPQSLNSTESKMTEKEVSREKDLSYILHTDEVVIIMGSGIALFCVMYITLFIPIDKSGPRIICIIIPMNTALVFSRKMQRTGPEYDSDDNQPVDIFFFLIFWFGAMHFIEYMVAFTSIALITKDINHQKGKWIGYVFGSNEAPASDAHSVGSNASVVEDDGGKESGPREVVTQNPSAEIQEPVPVRKTKSTKVVHVPPAHKSGKDFVVKMPSFEPQAADVPQQTYRTRSIRRTDGTELTEVTETSAANSHPDPDPGTDNDESDDTRSLRSESQETQPDYGTPDAQDEMVRRIRAGQRSLQASANQDTKKKLRQGDDYPMISYVPVDVTARSCFIYAFAFLLYIFFVVYVL